MSQQESAEKVPIMLLLEDDKESRGEKRKRLKTLTPKKILIRLPVLLAQVIKTIWVIIKDNKLVITTSCVCCFLN